MLIFWFYTPAARKFAKNFLNFWFRVYFKINYKNSDNSPFSEFLLYTEISVNLPFIYLGLYLTLTTSETEVRVSIFIFAKMKIKTLKLDN